MQNHHDRIVLNELYESLHAVVDEMLEPHGKNSPPGKTLLSQFSPPFDISKPNQHDRKQDFELELEIVESFFEHVQEILLLSRRAEEDRSAAMDKIRTELDEKLRWQKPDGPIESSLDLVRLNARQMSGTASMDGILLDVFGALAERLEELNDQREKFWNMPHRAPDHYARVIALRLARLYFQQTGTRPTTGTSGITGEASTGFSRSLAKVFTLLGIKRGVRSYAEWAISQLNDTDRDGDFGSGGYLARMVSGRRLIARDPRTGRIISGPKKGTGD